VITNTVDEKTKSQATEPECKNNRNYAEKLKGENKP